MRTGWGPGGLAWAVVLAAALLLGVGVAVASSLGSLSGKTPANPNVPPVTFTPSPSPVDTSPPPTVTSVGQMGAAPWMAVNGSNLAVISATRAAASSDGGRTWSAIVLPAGSSGIAIDPTNPRRAVAGGSAIRVTIDGGTTWQPAKTPPPGRGPYLPIEVSPFDGNVWFFTHQGQLLRTRDSGTTWRDLSGLPALSAPVLAPGHVFGELFLAAGNRVFELVDEGQQIVEQPALPAGVVVKQLAAGGGDLRTVYARDATGALHVLKLGAWSSVNGGLPGPITAGDRNVVVTADAAAKLGVRGGVDYSFDSGKTWNEASGLPTDQSIEAVAGEADTLTLFAYSYGGDVYSSTDGGRSWTVISRDLRARSG